MPATIKTIPLLLKYLEFPKVLSTNKAVKMCKTLKNRTLEVI